MSVGQEEEDRQPYSTVPAQSQEYLADHATLPELGKLVDTILLEFKLHTVLQIPVFRVHFFDIKCKVAILIYWAVS